jgi:hypothetical protein
MPDFTGAPRPMKMGTIASPRRYDAVVRHTPQSASLRCSAILHYASRAAVFRRVRSCTIADVPIDMDFRRDGPRPCENAKTRDADRKSYSSKSASAVNCASALNLTNELKNVFLAAF